MHRRAAADKTHDIDAETSPLAAAAKHNSSSRFFAHCSVGYFFIWLMWVALLSTGWATYCFRYRVAVLGYFDVTTAKAAAGSSERSPLFPSKVDEKGNAEKAVGTTRRKGSGRSFRHSLERKRFGKLAHGENDVKTVYYGHGAKLKGEMALAQHQREQHEEKEHQPTALHRHANQKHRTDNFNGANNSADGSLSQGDETTLVELNSGGQSMHIDAPSMHEDYNVSLPQISGFFESQKQENMWKFDSYKNRLARVKSMINEAMTLQRDAHLKAVQLYNRRRRELLEHRRREDSSVVMMQHNEGERRRAAHGAAAKNEIDDDEPVTSASDRNSNNENTRANWEDITNGKVSQRQEEKEDPRHQRQQDRQFHEEESFPCRCVAFSSMNQRRNWCHDGNGRQGPGEAISSASACVLGASVCLVRAKLVLLSRMTESQQKLMRLPTSVGVAMGTKVVKASVMYLPDEPKGSTFFHFRYGMPYQIEGKPTIDELAEQELYGGLASQASPFMNRKREGDGKASPQLPQLNIHRLTLEDFEGPARELGYLKNISAHLGKHRSVYQIGASEHKHLRFTFVPGTTVLINHHQANHITHFMEPMGVLDLAFRDMLVNTSAGAAKRYPSSFSPQPVTAATTTARRLLHGNNSKGGTGEPSTAPPEFSARPRAPLCHVANMSCFPSHPMSTLTFLVDVRMNSWQEHLLRIVTRDHKRQHSYGKPNMFMHETFDATSHIMQCFEKAVIPGTFYGIWPPNEDTQPFRDSALQYIEELRKNFDDAGKRTAASTLSKRVSGGRHPSTAKDINKDHHAALLKPLHHSGNENSVHTKLPTPVRNLDEDDSDDDDSNSHPQTLLHHAIYRKRDVGIKRMDNQQDNGKEAPNEPGRRAVVDHGSKHAHLGRGGGRKLLQTSNSNDDGSNDEVLLDEPENPKPALKNLPGVRASELEYALSRAKMQRERQHILPSINSKNKNNKIHFDIGKSKPLSTTVPPYTPRPDRNILISLRLTKRTVTDMPKLEAMVRQAAMKVGAGVRSIQFGKSSFLEQASRAQKANVLISLHGADLTNMMFQQRGSVAIELNPLFFFENRFYEMADALEIEYMAWSCTRGSCAFGGKPREFDQFIKRRGVPYDPYTQQFRRIPKPDDNQQITHFRWPWNVYPGFGCIPCSEMACCGELRSSYYGTLRESSIAVGKHRYEIQSVLFDSFEKLGWITEPERKILALESYAIWAREVETKKITSAAATVRRNATSSDSDGLPTMASVALPHDKNDEQSPLVGAAVPGKRGKEEDLDALASTLNARYEQMRMGQSKPKHNTVRMKRGTDMMPGGKTVKDVDDAHDDGAAAAGVSKRKFQFQKKSTSSGNEGDNGHMRQHQRQREQQQEQRQQQQDQQQQQEQRQQQQDQQQHQEQEQQQQQQQQDTAQQQQTPQLSPAERARQKRLEAKERMRKMREETMKVREEKMRKARSAAWGEKGKSDKQLRRSVRRKNEEEE